MVFTWGILTADSTFANQDLDQEIERLEAFAKIYHLIQAKYYKHQTGKQLIDAAIQGMIDSLDQHTQVLNKKTMSWLEKQSLGHYSGIGVTLEYRAGKFVIQSVIPDSPADIAGLKPNDIIVQINDIKTTSNQMDVVYQALLEDTDKPVKIKYYHSKQPEKIISVTINRNPIHHQSVQFVRYSPDILIIKIKQFQKHTATQILKGLQGKNFSSIIIDLRNNPGGLLLSAIETTQLFLSAGKLVEIKDKHGNVIEKFISRNQSTLPDLRLFILINRQSASAAEIMAGALKDREEGIIIGEQSYGKGTVQTVFPILDNLFIKLTTAKYYTPSGISFDGTGVPPHFAIKDNKAELYSKEDHIFQKALSLSSVNPSEK
jgi:carboxyl-terminal processing protease